MAEPTPYEEGLSELGFMGRLFAWKGIWSHWVILLSGIASVILGIIGAVKDAPLASWTFWAAAAICFLVAVFRASYFLYKRADDKRHDREQELVVATVMKLLLHDRPVVDEENGVVSVIVECFHGAGAPNCGVALRRSDPPIRDYSISLRCCGDRNLNAGEQRLFNVARINPETGVLEMMGADHEGMVAIEKRQYTITLRAHAANTPAWQEKTYILDVAGRKIAFFPVLDGDPYREVPVMVLPD